MLRINLVRQEREREFWMTDGVRKVGTILLPKFTVIQITVRGYCKTAFYSLKKVKHVTIYKEN